MTDQRDVGTLISHIINSLNQLLTQGSLQKHDSALVKDSLIFLERTQSDLKVSHAITNSWHDALDDILSYFKQLLEKAAIQSKKLIITLLRLVLNIENATIYDELGLPIRRGMAHNPSPLLGWNTSPSPFMKLLAADSLSIVYVTGSFGYGHTLLNLGLDKGYVHVNLLYGYPEYLTHPQFLAYLNDEGKEVDAILPLKGAHMPLVRRKLVELCAKRWLWLGPWRNCFDFCKDVAEAGGVDISSLDSHVPTNTLVNLSADDFNLEGRSQSPLHSWAPNPLSLIPIESQQEFASKLQKQAIQMTVNSYQRQPQKQSQLVDFIIENNDYVHRWQTPIQQQFIALKNPHRKIDPENEAARVIVESLVDKILTTDWHSGHHHLTIHRGEVITRRLPRHMKTMIEVVEQERLIAPSCHCNYVNILSQMQYLGYRAYQARNSWKSRLFRTPTSKAFYASFAGFFRPKLEELAPPDCSLTIDTEGTVYRS